MDHVGKLWKHRGYCGWKADKEIKLNLDSTRYNLTTMRLESKCRHQLFLLLQRQHLEEEELRLRHFMELEKFQNTLNTDNSETKIQSVSTSAVTMQSGDIVDEVDGINGGTSAGVISIDGGKIFSTQPPQHQQPQPQTNLYQWNNVVNANNEIVSGAEMFNGLTTDQMTSFPLDGAIQDQQQIHQQNQQLQNQHHQQQQQQQHQQQQQQQPQLQSQQHKNNFQQ